jgi:hypothetical protein
LQKPRTTTITVGRSTIINLPPQRLNYVFNL